MGLLIVLFIVLLGGGLAVETFILVATGNWHWDEYVSRTSKQLWTAGYVLALVGAIVLFGPAVTFSAWPVWVSILGGTFAVFGGLDLVFGVRRPQPRVIEHRTGERALVDGDGKGYQRLPLGETKPPSALDRWLQEKV